MFVSWEVMVSTQYTKWKPIRSSPRALRSAQRFFHPAFVDDEWKRELLALDRSKVEHALDLSSIRALHQHSPELIELVRSTGGGDFNRAVGTVGNPSRKLQATGSNSCKPSKADPLHFADDLKMHRSHGSAANPENGG
jgi:hypothetical protein